MNPIEKFVKLGIVFGCILGALLSYYSYYVETRLEDDSSYSPMCDISSHMSCSVAFLSEYGKGFGIVRKVLGEDSVLNQPNGILGVGFYALFMILGAGFNNNKLINVIVLLLALLGILSSVYLAYILYFILYDACIVCITTYFINAFLLFLSYKKLKLPKSKKEGKKMKAH